MTDVRIWHHGLMARWWAEFEHGGDDVAFFENLIRTHGEPALDAGCGTGRILLPCLRAGLDIDGADASADMLDECRRIAGSENLSVSLYAQPMHALELPRKYATIVVCGAFGLGGTRADDLEGLRRLRHHLLPGGTLVMDHYLPNVGSQRGWRGWIQRPDLPRPWPETGQRKRAADDSEFELLTRQKAFDPLEQTTVLEMQVSHFVDDEVVASETQEIAINVYFKNEIELMLASAGFDEIRVTGGLEQRAAEPWMDQRIVFRARR